jgi:GTP cyclohydrolase I
MHSRAALQLVHESPHRDLAAGSATITSTLLGALREDPRSREEFFALTRANT